jgi:hypothetical protein
MTRRFVVQNKKRDDALERAGAALLLAELADELLLGKPSGGPRYHQRKYPEGKRALAARAALAKLLRAEAPEGRYTGLLAEMISPHLEPGTSFKKQSTHTVIRRQTVEFIPPRGGKRASGRLELDIAKFVRKKLAQVQKERLKKKMLPLKEDRLDKRTVGQAAACFRVSEKTIRSAWKLFAKGKTTESQTLRAAAIK